MSTQELILIRGLPGSGKSTLAYTIWNMHDDAYPDRGGVRIETDDFFVRFDTRKGKEVYEFDRDKLPEAHKQCQTRVRKALENDSALVIVSNTFTRLWEMQPYIDMAREFNAKLTVLTCEGNYGNVHGVPDEVIEKMRSRWERYEG